MHSERVTREGKHPAQLTCTDDADARRAQGLRGSGLASTAAV
jgi:hypothetical protein